MPASTSPTPSLRALPERRLPPVNRQPGTGHAHHCEAATRQPMGRSVITQKEAGRRALATASTLHRTAVDVRRRWGAPRNARRHADHARDERVVREAIGAFRRFVILPAPSFFPRGVPAVPSLFFPAGGCTPFSRTSAGTSASLALRLNCKA